MPDKPPPIVDADFKVVHGPWPASVLHLGLVKLALRAAGAVAALILMGSLLLVAFWR